MVFPFMAGDASMNFRAMPALDGARSPRYPFIMARLLDWNGKNIPAALRELPPGRYVVESVDLVPELTAEEDEGLAVGLASLARGEGIPAEEVHSEMRAFVDAKARETRQRRKR